jgi:glycerol-1-phosphate dehydrogenase [NAD(P)+]
MGKQFFEEFLNKYSRDGTYPCSCGQQHSIKAKHILVGKGALSAFPALVSESFGSGCRVWVLSDRNTEEAAGLSLKKALKSFNVTGVVLPRSPKPQPTLENVLELNQRVKETMPDLLVSVGGGTISDMVKKISHDTGVTNWCVPTCPSVDAYTSGTAAIWERGYHTSLPSSGSEAIVCDLAVLESAPEELILSGFGDLLGKYLAYLDWHLSHTITQEPFCEELARLSLESAKRTFDDAVSFALDRESAIGSLTDALLTSGLVMQSVGSSRPAGSAEHTIAHFWEMTKTVHNEKYDLHGVLAGLAGTLVLAAYREFYRRLNGLVLDISGRAGVFEKEPGWEQGLERAILPYKFKMIDEMERKGRLDRKTLEERLTRFIDLKDKIQDLAEKRLEELERAVVILDRLGFPLSLSALGMRPDGAFLPFRYVRYLRNRYSSFDLMYETGLEGGVLEALKRSVPRGRPPSPPRSPSKA